MQTRMGEPLPARPARARAASCVRLALAGTVALVAAFALLTLVAPALAPAPAAGARIQTALLALAAVAVAARVVLVPGERLAWGAVAASLALWAAGDAWWNADVAGSDAPFPSAADWLWMAGYPLLWLALALLVRERAGRRGVSPWLDGIATGLAVTAAGAALIVPAVTAATGADAAAVATNLVYPLADLILLGLAAGALALAGWQAGAGWLLLCASLAVQAGVDAAYLGGQATGSWSDGGPADWVWPACGLLMALAAWIPGPALRRPARRDASLVVPAAVAPVALAVLVIDELTDVGPLPALLALAALGAMAVRTALVLLENRRLVARLSREATTDPLTGLANRGELDRRLAAEVARARRHSRPFSLVVVDLDHFKAVNDAHGHPTGDRALREVAAHLAAHARRGDSVGRIGGEEFAWLLPETPGPAAWAAAERMRAGLAAAPLPGVGRVTVSAGVADAAHLGPGESSEGLLRLADAALYRAKARGRDATVLFAPEVAPTPGQDPQAELQRAQTLGTVRALARAVDARDPATFRHSERVAALAERLGRARGWDEPGLGALREAALLHDVGKIGVPDTLLRSPGPLDEAGWERVRAHAALGAQIVGDVLGPDQAAWVRHHHERWDGDGYPDGLAGRQIPEGARLIAVAEAWDAMTSPRAHRPARTPGEALAEIRAGAGRQFCPVAVGALEAVLAAAEPQAQALREAAAAS